MEIRGMMPNPDKGMELSPARQKEDRETRDACKQFETLFLSQMMTQMKASIPQNDLFGDGKERQMYEDMLGQEQAKAWSDSGGIGLANLLYQQLRKNQ